VKPSFVAVTVAQGLRDPLHHFIIEDQSLEYLGEPLLQNLLSRVGLRTLTLETRAVIIDVAAFLDFLRVCTRPGCSRAFEPRGSGGRPQEFCTAVCRRRFNDETRRDMRVRAKKRARRVSVGLTPTRPISILPTAAVLRPPRRRPVC
jgi:hypothetical protein